MSKAFMDGNELVFNNALDVERFDKYLARIKDVPSENRTYDGLRRMSQHRDAKLYERLDGEGHPEYVEY